MPARSSKAPPRLNQQLVLHRLICADFGYDDMRQMLKEFEDNLPIEELGDAYHPFIDRVQTRGNRQVTDDALETYGHNIRQISQRLKMAPGDAHSWKPHQYLALLFTERYLDLYFDDAEALCVRLNAFCKSDAAFASISQFTDKDLATIGFQSATGSGKTLIMHANLLQYQLHTTKPASNFNAIYLLTPDAGMSKQHLDELSKAGIPAQRYVRDQPITTGSGQRVIQIIEINNLDDVSKEKQVAVSELGTRNLVLVDEGHLGQTSTSVWRKRREELAIDGFTMEYSATFNQIAKAPSAAEIREAKAQDRPPFSLLDTYSKCLLFDYSYRYFYHDGYGKDFAIANLVAGLQSDSHRTYQVANMLAFYQQMRIYDELGHHWVDYNIERPLWVMLGHTVTTGAGEGKLNAEQKDPTRSDILEIIRFLSWTLDKRAEVETLISAVLAGNAGLQDTHGNEWAADRLQWLMSKGETATDLYDGLCGLVFHGTGQLHLTYLTQGEGELHLSSSDGGKCFGVINVGDAKGVYDLVVEHLPHVNCHRDAGFTDRLFIKLDRLTSPVTLLVGARKFIAGWNSWRVSTMTLLNVGQGQGPQVIQMFGRGVRLKGFEMSLKRHRRLKTPSPDHSDELALLETLNIYGLKANYMEAFRTIIREEKLGNPPLLFTRLVKRQFQETLKLPMLRTKEGRSYARHGEVTTINLDGSKVPAELNLYPGIEVMAGSMEELAAQAEHEQSTFDKEKFLFDRKRIYRHLLDVKQRNKLHNLAITQSLVDQFINDDRWYRLYMPPTLQQIDSLADIRRREDHFISLACQFVRRNWNVDGWSWEQKNKELVDLKDDDANFIKAYQIALDKDALLETKTESQVDQIINDIEALCKTDEASKINALGLEIKFPSMHAYTPILCLTGNVPLKISPVALNDGETKTVNQIIELCNGNFFDGWNVFLMRNASRGGIGFFPSPGSFYPDFICWLKSEKLTHIVFIDPKGMVHGDNTLKVNLHKNIKKIEEHIGNSRLKLHSYILSVSDKPTSNPDKGIFNLKEDKSAVERIFKHVFDNI